MATTTTKRHPIRGFFWGIPFGLGLALIAVGQKWVALGTWPPFIILIVGIVISVLWGMFGPAKGPKGEPPSLGAEPTEPDPEPEAEPAEEPPAEEAFADITADTGVEGADGDISPVEGDDGGGERPPT